MTATLTAPTRQHMTFPVVLMTTKFGQVEATFNGANSLYIHTSYGPTSRCSLIEIRGVAYSIGVHVNRNDDNYMQVSGATPYEQYQHVSIHRTELNKEPSSAARKTVTEMAIEVAARAALENPDLFRQAELVVLNNSLKNLGEEIARKQAELDALNDRAARERAREALLQTEETGA